MQNNLFIYGTLAPGRSNHYIMDGIDGHWQKATTHGHLKQLGWGAQQGYPAIHPDPDGPLVDGYLLTSTVLQQHWGRLDEFEGEEYQRVEIDVTTESGELVQAYVYALNQS